VRRPFAIFVKNIDLDTNPDIIIRGARVNNLKNISLNIPRNRFVVITGLSGSGKSSLAFDTLYAEGQRRYVESLSSYARQFLGRIQKPEVDFIHGIPPAIALEQKVNTRNPRSTVGTSTEIYDYLKLLFARIGTTYAPSGQEVRKHTVTDVVRFLSSFPEGTPALIMYPLFASNKARAQDILPTLMQQGYTRMEREGSVMRIEDILEQRLSCTEGHQPRVIVDRIKTSPDSEATARWADSVQTAFSESNGFCVIRITDGPQAGVTEFSARFECDGMSFEEPSEHLFSFNSPFGACPRCEGYGRVIGIDEDLVIPDKSLSVYQDAVACWRGETMSAWKEKLIYAAPQSGFPIHKPVYQLSPEHKDMLWNGTRHFKGIHSFFAYLDEHRYKIQCRVMLARYSGKTVCPDCHGGRLREEARYVKINGRNICDLVEMSVASLRKWFSTLDLDDNRLTIGSRILGEIRSRLGYIEDVGLGYLTLNRLSSTLSGGESQRVNLASSLGSSLVGALYILDEPSIGLHPADTHKLIGILRDLQQLGNSVIVVEHDEEIMKAADHIIDIGPQAGRLGGEIVFEGSYETLMAGSPDLMEHSSVPSITVRYLRGLEQIAVPALRRPWNQYIEVSGAGRNNLRYIDVRFPLHVLCVVTGVSGSGKSTLVRDILYESLSRKTNGHMERVCGCNAITGDLQDITSVEFIDQNPIGKSSRSNPVTYSKAYDEIRKLFAEQPVARHNDLTPSHFSFNTEGGRCDVCQGEGEITVEMQFMADVKLVCEHCKGMKFKDEILEVTYRSRNIYEVLEMTVSEAIDFFGHKKTGTEKKIIDRLQPLSDVGLGYVKLGQSSSTLSGGENQRIKLASFLTRESVSKPSLFIFDEPTTGLHFHDIRKLLDAFHSLIARGHSLVIIEHNMEIVKSADWVIDLGPGGGDEGGCVVCAGTPEEVARCPESSTGHFLAPKLTAL